MEKGFMKRICDRASDEIASGALCQHLLSGTGVIDLKDICVIGTDNGELHMAIRAREGTDPTVFEHEFTEFLETLQLPGLWPHTLTDERRREIDALALHAEGTLAIVAIGPDENGERGAMLFHNGDITEDVEALAYVQRNWEEAMAERAEVLQ